MKNEESAGQKPSELQPSGQPPSLLVVKSQMPLSREDNEMISMCMEPVGKMLGAQVVVAPDGLDVQWQQGLGPLIAAITAQTEAINRLAASNEALVEAMVEDDPDVDELVPRHLDGSPVL